MKQKELSVDLQDWIVLRPKYGKEYKKISAALKVPLSTLASIIPTGRFRTTKALPRTGQSSKLSN